MIFADFDLQVASILLTEFPVNWLFASGKKPKSDFQNSGYLGFPIVMILAIFNVQVAPILPTKFRVNWPFPSEEAHNRFSRWQPYLPILTILAIFNLQIAPILPTKFGVNWLSGSGEEVQN